MPGLVIALAVLWAGCEPHTEIPLSDAGDQGPCPAGYFFIPSGSFEMGISPGDPLHGLDIQLFGDMMMRRTVILSDYCIQKTEVTAGAFKTCRRAGKCTGPFQDQGWNEMCNYSGDLDDRDNHPMNCISWAAAREFCQQWEGGDLPSDAQWEKAARGTDQRLFPWGNEKISCDRANWDENGPYSEEGGGEGHGCNHCNTPATWPVGSLAHKGDSPYGLRDMSGNVSEWVLECFGALTHTCGDAPCVDPVHTCDSGPYATRGGSAEDFVMRIFTVVAHGSMNDVDSSVGFRCAFTPSTRRHSIGNGR